jgi:hypothetical protein
VERTACTSNLFRRHRKPLATDGTSPSSWATDTNPSICVREGLFQQWKRVEISESVIYRGSILPNKLIN